MDTNWQLPWGVVFCCLLPSSPKTLLPLQALLLPLYLWKPWKLITFILRMNAKGLKQKSKVKCCKLTAFLLTSSLPEEGSLQKKKKVVLALNLGFGRVTDRKADLQHFGVLGFFGCFFFPSTIFSPVLYFSPSLLLTGLLHLQKAFSMKLSVSYKT